VIRETNEQGATLAPRLGAVNQQVRDFMPQAGVHREHKGFEKFSTINMSIRHPTLETAYNTEQLTGDGCPQRDIPQLHMAA
jgi:hypothetical protein